MVNKEILTRQFETLGYNVEDNEVILQCLDLCDLYNLSEDDLVEEWVSYVLSNNLTDEANPSLENLKAFENAHLKSKLSKEAKQKKIQGDEAQNKIAKLADDGTSKAYVEDEDILQIYGFKPSTSSTKRARSPENGVNTPIISESKIRAVESSYSPASYAIKTKIPIRESVAATSGKILKKFGKSVDSWKNEAKRSVEIRKVLQTPSEHMYMFDILSRRMEILENYCHDVGKKISEAWPLENEEMVVTANVAETLQEPFRTFGRIKCEKNAKNSNLVTLCNWHLPENDEDKPEEAEVSKDKRGCAVSTSLSFTVKSFSCFPGQLIAVEGKSVGSDDLAVTRMSSLVGCESTPAPQLTGSMQIVIACGPFTQSDRLDFQPLMSLMQNIVETEPNLLILVGPFVPQENDDVTKCHVVETFEEIFQHLLQKIAKSIKGLCTQVMLVASSRDAFHDNIYPSPEYFIPPSAKAANIHTISDPGMISVEGLVIGCTAVDIIKHMAGKEISQNMAGTDRIVRLAEHVLQQASFYPLYPPSKEVNLDLELWEKYGQMRQRPHILLLPSSLKQFCSWSNDTLLINPGDMAKNSYARLIIRPDEKQLWTANCVDCEILKI